MTRLTIFAATVALFVALSLPAATQKPVFVYVEKPKPLMWLECGTNARIERERICRARAKSERTRL